MRVAMVSPYSLDRAAGNSVTVTRISRSLAAMGCLVKVFSLEEYSGEALKAAIEEFNPDLIHAYHAFNSGAQAQPVAHCLNLPFIITMTGTDIYKSEDYTLDELQLLRQATAITVFTAAAKEKLAGYLAKELINVIPQGVAIGSVSSISDHNETFNFLLPAGIRPVKNVLYPVEPIAQLARKYPEIRLQLLGEIIDSAYAVDVLSRYEKEPTASWLGSVAYGRMPEIYSTAAVILNCSLSEGGMANSLLEAMQLGIPVLAADVEGNRSLVIDGINGLLYQDVDSFINKAERLFLDAELRAVLIENGKRFVEENCSASGEAAHYVELYGRVVQA